jgi:hypothetical protein
MPTRSIRLFNGFDSTTSIDYVIGDVVSITLFPRLSGAGLPTGAPSVTAGQMQTISFTATDSGVIGNNGAAFFYGTIFNVTINGASYNLDEEEGDGIFAQGEVLGNTNLWLDTGVSEDISLDPLVTTYGGNNITGAGVQYRLVVTYTDITGWVRLQFGNGNKIVGQDGGVRSGVWEQFIIADESRQAKMSYVSGPVQGNMMVSMLEVPASARSYVGNFTSSTVTDLGGGEYSDECTYYSTTQQAVETNTQSALRTASSFNRIPNLRNTTFAASSNIRLAGRNTHFIGSGDLSELRLCYNNWGVEIANLILPTTDLTIVEAWLELENPNHSVQVLFGGSSGAVVPAGQGDVVSDAILPASFGLTKFTQGQKLFIRAVTEVPQGADIPMARHIEGAGSRGAWYDPSSTALVNNINGTAAFEWTDFNLTGGGLGTTPIILGRYLDEDPYTYAGFGDSIFDQGGGGDDTGRGYFSKSMALSPVTSGLNFSSSSGISDALISGGVLKPLVEEMYKYCSGAIEEYGTNNFDASANYNSSAFGYVTDRFQELWDEINLKASPNASGFKFIRTKLLCRTQVPPNQDITGQTVYGDKWTIGGDVEKFNDYLDVNSSNFTTIMDAGDLFRGSSDPLNADYYLWANGNLSAADGTHPTNQLSGTLGAELKSLFNPAADSTPPTYALTPPTTAYNLTVGDLFTLPTLTLTDDIDGVNTPAPTSNTVDLGVVGSYSVVWSGLGDAAGNTISDVTVTVEVVAVVVASNLNMTLTDTPDGANDVRVINPTTQELIYFGSASFSSGSAVLAVTVNAGTSLEYYAIGATDGGLQRGTSV